MTTHPNTPTRWRPRFSVRTLVVFVTLVCAYLGQREATKRFGVLDVVAHVSETDYHGSHDLDQDDLAYDGYSFDTSFIPLVVGVEMSRGWDVNRTRYYFWFFGHVTKLYDREWSLPGRT